MKTIKRDDDQAILSDVIHFDQNTRLVISLYGDSGADNLAANSLYRKICQLIDRETIKGRAGDRPAR